MAPYYGLDIKEKPRLRDRTEGYGLDCLEGKNYWYDLMRDRYNTDKFPCVPTDKVLVKKHTSVGRSADKLFIDEFDGYNYSDNQKGSVLTATDLAEGIRALQRHHDENMNRRIEAEKLMANPIYMGVDWAMGVKPEIQQQTYAEFKKDDFVSMYGMKCAEQKNYSDLYLKEKETERNRFKDMYMGVFPQERKRERLPAHKIQLLKYRIKYLLLRHPHLKSLYDTHDLGGMDAEAEYKFLKSKI